MSLNSTKDFVTSIIDFCKGTIDNVLNNTKPFPRWKAPEALDKGEFEKEASALYKKEISIPKHEQDVEKLINRGNDYYFAMMVKKSHRMYTRTRIEAVAINKSLEKGFTDEGNGFLEKKYKYLGDVLDPNDEIKGSA